LVDETTFIRTGPPGLTFSRFDRSAVNIRPWYFQIDAKVLFETLEFYLQNPGRRSEIGRYRRGVPPTPAGRAY
jgi:hypothetical protein